MSSQTREGIAQLRAGNAAAGRATLMQAFASGEPAGPIWYALALAADSADEKHIYLQKAVEADPLHEDARRDLAALSSSSAPRAAGPAMAPIAGDSQEAAASARALGGRTERKGGAPLALVLVLLIVAACGFFAMASGGGASGGGRAPAANAPDKYGAWDICTQQVTKQLRAPATATFPSLSAGDVTVTQDGKKFAVVGYVDAENGFGAMIRNDFVCEATHQSGTSWNVRASLVSR